MGEGVLRSPLEMMEGAMELMLDGNEPRTDIDWKKVVAFWSVNIHHAVQPSGILLLCKIMDCPLSENEILRLIIEQMIVRVDDLLKGIPRVTARTKRTD
jgi:hypothetical protein